MGGEGRGSVAVFRENQRRESDILKDLSFSDLSTQIWQSTGVCCHYIPKESNKVSKIKKKWAFFFFFRIAFDICDHNECVFTI